MIAAPWILLGITGVTLLIGVWTTLVIQKGVNFCSEKHSFPMHKTTKGEVVIVALGILLAVGNIFVIFNPGVFEPKLTPRQQFLYDRAESLAEDYNKCFAELEAQYSKLAESGEALAAKEERCETIRIKQNKAADAYDASVSR